MLRDVVSALPLPDHRLRVTFDNGQTGEVDVTQLVKFAGVFAPLSDVVYFSSVQVNAELGVVCWPNGADIDSDVLYSHAIGVPILSTTIA